MAVADDVVPLPPPPPQETNRSKEFVTTKYPRMMADEKYPEDYKEDDDDVVSQPRWLLPNDHEERSAKFDSAFSPIADLSSEDVVCGCAVKGAEFVQQSRDHVSNFRDHLRGVDQFSKLEAGKLAELPVAATKACVGGGFYSIALTAKFGPRALDWTKRKCVDWRVYEKTAQWTQVVKQKTGQGYEVTKQGVKIAFSWLKTKVATFYGLESSAEDGETKDLESGAVVVEHE